MKYISIYVSVVKNIQSGDDSMEYIAHIRKHDHKIQTVKEHLLEVKDLAEQYGEKIGVKYLAGLAGLLHDLGKLTNEFREYILQAVNDPNNAPRRGSVDHSTAGGKLLYEFLHSGKKVEQTKWLLAEIIGNAIISHHSSLQDYLNPQLESPYLRRVKLKELHEFPHTKEVFFSEIFSEKDFNEYVKNAEKELSDYLERCSGENMEIQIMFLTKYIFSALIDADRTNTMLFEEKLTIPSMPTNQLFKIYYERLMALLETYASSKTADLSINRLRADMSKQCDDFAAKPSGIYTLSIPTGGGKTLASLRYALKHAINHKSHPKKRIIYVVPYTSIIEQNAAEVKKHLKDGENILEHHSNVVDDIEDDEHLDGFLNAQQKLQLAKDNWDSPIIFTTMVKFLDVFYAKGNRNTRRLHNLSDSVIIFDEVQKVPIKCVSLFNQALNFLKMHANSSIVLCTATQPALDFVENKLNINTDAEIIDRIKQVNDAFKRVEVIDHATNRSVNNDEIVQFIGQKLLNVSTILIILNTKKVVKELYLKLKDADLEIPVYHLSTSMCASHRRNILSKVKSRLNNNQPVICISTQLIEAGVDVSFQCVIRSLAGLDSIAQAAGRCNRHGKDKIRYVYVIDHNEENLRSLKEIDIGKKISKRILLDLHKDRSNHGGHLLSSEAMERYFKEFYTDMKNDLDYFIPKYKMHMTELLSAGRSKKNSIYHAYKSKFHQEILLILLHSHDSAAQNFHVIDQQTTSLLVPYDKGNEIIRELQNEGTINNLTESLRKAQQYSVDIYRQDLKKLIENDALISLFDGKVLALKEEAYDKEFGLELGRITM